MDQHNVSWGNNLIKVNKNAFHWEYTEEPHRSRRLEILGKHPEIKKLMKSDGDRNLVLRGLVLTVCQISLGVINDWLTYAPLRFLFICLVGTWLTTAVMLHVHEAAHGLIFGPNHVWKNRIYGLVINLSLGLPFYSFFKKHHKIHHMGDEFLDCEYPSDLEVALFSDSPLGKYLWILENPLIYSIRTPVLMVQRFKIRHGQKFLIRADDSSMDLVIDHRPFESDTDNVVGAIPDDAMRPGGRYEVQGFVLNTTGKTYLKAYISHIHDPDQFYFQLIENHNSLNAMMDRLQSFYSSDKSRFYKICSEDLIIGLPVVAIYETSDGPIWRRALITDVSSDRNSVEVFYVDYGNKVIQPLKKLRMMRQKFMPILAQAVRAKLANVKKPDGLKEWPEETTNTMISFFGDYPLICEVVGLEQNCFVVNVCDTYLPNRDVYLHHFLVNFGLAQYTAMLTAPFSVDDLDNRCYLNIT